MRPDELRALLPMKKSFDLLEKAIVIGQRQCTMYFVDGFVKDDLLQRIMQFWYSIKKEQMDRLQSLEQFGDQFMPYVEYTVETDPQKAVDSLLAGPALMLIEGLEGCIVLDTRTYPARGVDEPEKDKVLRGSRDGFTETVVFNTALIRRRIRDPKLVFEIFSVGAQSKTDVVVGYIGGKADEKLLQSLRERLQQLDVKNEIINQQNLVELLLPRPSLNPFPKVRNSERPDVTAANLVEGRVVLLVDNCPTSIILPTRLVDFTQEADDFYFPPLVGWYMKMIRISTAFVTMLITPVWMLALHYPDKIPSLFSFLKVENTSALPIVLQLILIEFAIDGLRLASINTPSVLSSSFSIVGGLILGDFAVQSGVAIPQTIFYMSFVAIATFSQPSIELGYSIKFCRMGLLVLTWAFGIWGFGAGLVLIFIMAAVNSTITRDRYLSPICPFKPRGFIDLFKRRFARNSQHPHHS
ncbi:spore germination protein [Neobittarella massiliensis]|uniref:spore germination protein n=1 Tax=Neobittarella massiliensis (ex Bilen et al. 2018) TaxID=2041842 RepID=UPI000CF6F647|nr:spore germination protein [Neobittarella massiliensis]